MKIKIMKIMIQNCIEIKYLNNSLWEQIMKVIHKQKNKK